VVVTVFACVVPPAVASPGDDATAVAEPITNVAPGANGNKSARCPTGQVATGGGVGFVGSLGSGATVIRNQWPASFAGTDTPDAWITTIANLSGAAQNYTAYVICSPTGDSVERRTSFTTSGDGGNRADCEPGERALSGGLGQQIGPDSTALQVSNPLDETNVVAETTDGDVARGWFVSARHSEGIGRMYFTYVVCSASSRATLQVTPFTVNHGQSGQQVVMCPTGERALGGGLGTTGGRLGSMGFSAPVDENGAANIVTGSIPRGWFVDVYNITGTTQTYHAYVTCEGPTPPGGGGGGGGDGDGPGGGGGGDGAGTQSCAGQTATVSGTDGAETLSGTTGDDVIAAGGGADTVRGRGGDDLICGAGGPDVLKGQGGKDKLLGGSGRDRLGGGGGSGDVCDGAGGRDRASDSCEKEKRI
jgi:hypothetical protein